ncbi:hypothetical protein [Deinococcus maricopensis]|uniref:DUF1440 domain-containing protein n=1 Tax=Deinococcus maricopensis (strain DSM 21211 / LMG 22137 / NRRL B-23946 / LB-34) TaxID=709986 RepID=E8U5G0_DEIML|nr:hypothetical protein [Deinococcus maricopensis]ADV66299.1 hypothetical protein Deima_0642 [Deinococcus maricopensis DSM 21211]
MTQAVQNMARGALAGAVGTLCMGQFAVRVVPILTRDEPPATPGAPDRDVISPFGQQHRPGESSTAAIGRRAYTAVTGRAPDARTAAALSEAVHWGMGVGSGALFGLLTGARTAPALGVAFGAALWTLVDETLVPLLGLQDGPRGTSVRTHAARLGMHLAYGTGLGVAAWVWRRRRA